MATVWHFTDVSIKLMFVLLSAIWQTLYRSVIKLKSSLKKNLAYEGKILDIFC